MKTISIYHSVDLDGWMSAAIVKKWFLDKENGAVVHSLNDSKLFKDNNIGLGNPNPTSQLYVGRESDKQLYMLGWDYGDEIPDLSEYDKVIMCDISFPAEKMGELFVEKDYPNIVWIDHHISAITDVDSLFRTKALGHIGGLRDTKFAACELTWKYFFSNETMPEIVRLLGRYDCFGSKGTDEEQKVLEFQYGARQCISNYEYAYTYLKATTQPNNDIIGSILADGGSIYSYLCTEAKQTYNKAFPVYLKELDGDLMPKKWKFLCGNKERFNPVNFGIDYHKDGYDGFACFWYANEMWNFSLYNDNNEVDCSAIAKSFGGGGHRGSAGFRIDNIETFINEHKA